MWHSPRDPEEGCIGPPKSLDGTKPFQLDDFGHVSFLGWCADLFSGLDFEGIAGRGRGALSTSSVCSDDSDVLLLRSLGLWLSVGDCLWLRPSAWGGHCDLAYKTEFSNFECNCEKSWREYVTGFGTGSDWFLSVSFGIKTGFEVHSVFLSVTVDVFDVISLRLGGSGGGCSL